MRVSIGILAHDAERSVATTVASVMAQDLFTRPSASLARAELLVVANGCHDDTAGVATRALQALAPDPRLHAAVHSLATAGKSNAWNEYVHRLADPDADYLVLLDADVQLLEPGVLDHLVGALSADPTLLVATGYPIKHIALKQRRSVLDRLSLATSDLARRSAPGAIPGWAYCIRGPFARSVWMPVGIQVEDGFLAAMVATDQFRSPESADRVRMIPEARVCSEAYTSLKDIVRHEIRLMEGSVVNSYLYTFLWANSAGAGAGPLIGAMNDKKRSWLAEYVQGELAGKGRWVVPTHFLTKRIAGLGQLGAPKALAFLPVAVTRTLLDWYVAVVVNQRLRQGRWGSW